MCTYISYDKVLLLLHLLLIVFLALHLVTCHHLIILAFFVAMNDTLRRQEYILVIILEEAFNAVEAICRFHCEYDWILAAKFLTVPMVEVHEVIDSF